ncbi:hypothetical protein L1987_21497 [Smallanthus sonchifolius]|uniref:Uncharacterized protein n=1 Tax=Smallanthus sonchifolius TaxID=185202 RepID=A0ACB9IXM8_9ASTR|nr:hypothetical protein L1987_21497 [Smallanthus sonchifolius]
MTRFFITSTNRIRKNTTKSRAENEYTSESNHKFSKTSMQFNRRNVESLMENLTNQEIDWNGRLTANRGVDSEGKFVRLRGNLKELYETMITIFLPLEMPAVFEHSPLFSGVHCF